MNAAAIHTAEILVRFTNPPEDGKKASIKASDGTTYGVKPVDFGRFQPGARYRIEYVEKEGRGRWEGRTFRDIVKGEPVQAKPAATPMPQQRPTGDGDAPPTGEAEFVARCLAASITARAVGHTREAMVAEIRLLRSAWRDGMA